MLTITKVRDANVMVEGVSTHGQAAEVTLPDVQFEKTDYKALGLQGVLKYFNGFGALECSIKWNYPENAVQIACANPLKAVRLQVRSSKSIFKGSNLVDEQPVLIYLSGTSNAHPLGTFKPKEDTDLTTKLDITYMKQEVNGREIIEIDVPNNIFRIDGVDVLAKYKQNLGI